MSNRFALGIAVLLGILSIVGIRLYVQRLEQTYKQQLNEIPVLVAARDVPAGSTFAKEDLDSRPFPRAFLEDALKGTHISDENIVVGARTVADIAAGQVLQTYHFNLSVQRGAALKDSFSADYRAYTIPIGPAQAVAGLLRPGDYVDVMVTLPFTGASGQGTTVTFVPTALRNVLVLATDTITDPYDPRAGRGVISSLTLRLRPEDCNLLKHCLDTGGAVNVSYAQPKTPPSEKVQPVTPDVIYNGIDPELRQALQGARRR